MLSDVVNRGHAKRYRISRPTIHRTVTWFAILAVLAQTVLFDLAMAARETAAARERIATARHAAHHAPRDDRNAPQHQHDRQDCPFCVARATHQAPTPPTGGVLSVPLSMAVVVPLLLPRGRVRARRRPTHFRSRSPPHEPLTDFV
jgi:hypothetical protein